jgi:DNA transformation protein and related proteins
MTIKNIGAKTQEWLAEIGVYSLEDVERLGVVMVYRRLKERFPEKVSLNALWGLQGAVMGINYSQIPPEVKAALLEELEGKD